MHIHYHGADGIPFYSAQFHKKEKLVEKISNLKSYSLDDISLNYIQQ